jgi:NhaP-type Na+/H+ or K+/H+ antiporter
MSADPIAIALLTLGVIFLAGLATDVLGRRTRLPRVTLLLLLGVCVGHWASISSRNRAWSGSPSSRTWLS